jgi:hypothetical protein
LKDILEFCYNFEVVSLAFDGDFCFNGLQENMFTDLAEQIDAEGPGLPNVRTGHLASGDPLHIKKRIRYRWICSTFRIGYDSEEKHLFLSGTDSDDADSFIDCVLECPVHKNA